MMMGNGPPRSGWLMKVVVWPSLVGISICWSIMVLLFRSCFLRAGPDYHDCAETAARKRSPVLKEARRRLEQNRADRHCQDRPAAGDVDVTQTSNRFFDEIGRLMN